MEENEIIHLIRSKIEADEKLGEFAGGSGHLSDISYTLDEISEPEKSGEGTIVRYKYTISITTEFTVYPDNPPYEYKKEGEIVLTNK